MYTDDWSIRQKFQNELLQDEQIEWCGQSNPNILFTKSDMYLIPFSLLWGGFVILWNYMVNFVAGPSGHLDLVARLFGLPFLVVGLYFIFGRFIYKKWRKKNTYYAVTNKRVLCLTNTFNANLESRYIKDLPVVRKSINASGIGTVIFGEGSAMYGNTGMEALCIRRELNALAFYDIHDAGSVYDLVTRIKDN